MSEEQTRELVEQLKVLNGEGDEDGDAEKILRKIRKLKQPSAIGMLLLLRSGQDDDKWLSGEWDEVFSTITGFPKKTYAVEFGKVAPEFARASHYPFVDFISIIIGQDLIDTFLSGLPTLSPEARDLLISKIKAEEDEPDVVKERVQRLHDGIRQRTAG
jgi:hypothetical protein